jgi:hypothetical protein
MKVHDRVSRFERRASSVSCSVSLLFCTLPLTKAILFLFYSCFCYHKSRKEDERRTETDIESTQQHYRLASIHKIGQQQLYRQPQYSDNIATAAPSTIWSNNHNHKQQQQYGDATISVRSARERRSIPAEKLGARLASSQEQYLPSTRLARSYWPAAAKRDRYSTV